MIAAIEASALGGRRWAGRQEKEGGQKCYCWSGGGLGGWMRGRRGNLGAASGCGVGTIEEIGRGDGVG